MRANTVIPALTAGGIVWAATAYHYINTGESIAWILFCLFVLWTVYKKETGCRFSLPHRIGVSLLVLYGGLLGATLFHLDNLDNLFRGYYSWSGFLSYTFSMWALLYIGWTRDVRKPIFWTLAGIVYVLCAASLYQYLVLGVLPHGVYRTQHVTTMMIDLFLPIMTALGFYYREKRIYRLVSWGSVPLQMMILVAAKVRGADLAIAGAVTICVLASLFLRGRRHIGKMIALSAVAVGLAIFIGIGHTVVSNSAGEVHMRGGGDRVYMWSAAYNIWKDHPLTGVGLNEWMTTYESPEYYPEGAREKGHDHPHNVFVFFFATGGLIGGMAYVIYCLLIPGYFLSLLRKEMNNPIAWGMLFAFIAMTVHGLVDCNFIFKLVGRTFYMLMGAALLFLHWRVCDRGYIDKNRKGPLS